ncbi:unnamed protein product [Diatraea saccharalis]|uniref:Uncharacterized protein n=1 Tax=Diatraea saccharalis TaxID=40085 RepID=A0A9N9QWG0_9NEOP|nr:unnamed protein product [Diatraea saccharalis]
MNLFPQPRDERVPIARIEIVQPTADDCCDPPPPEGNVKHLNYRLLNENVRAYTPTGDINTSPSKGKIVSRFDVCSAISPPRSKILELLRPEDPGRETLEAIVRPASRRGLTRPFDDDTRRFLQRALLSPSPQGLSAAPTPEPTVEDPPSEVVIENPRLTSTPRAELKRERSLADELREAEEDERSGAIRRDIWSELRKGGVKEWVERERLGKLALSVEEDEDEEHGGLYAAARKLDALLAESRALHRELAGIQRDMQVLARRAASRDP